MSRMPPSFSGGLLCASADVAALASTQANAPATIRFMETSLDRFVPPCWRLRVGRDHAAWLQGQQATRPRTSPCAVRLFPLSGMDSSLRQQPLARHVVDLEANAVGILEQHRVIAGRPLILARRTDDGGS